MLSHGESHIVESRITKYTKGINFNNLSLNVCLCKWYMSSCFFLALLLFVLRRMFSNQVCLEILGSAALVAAVFTGKRLLPSVRSRVLF